MLYRRFPRSGVGLRETFILCILVARHVATGYVEAYIQEGTNVCRHDEEPGSLIDLRERFHINFPHRRQLLRNE